MRANPAISILCLPLFGEDECDALLEQVGQGAWEPGRIALPQKSDQGEEQTIRRCHQSDFEDPVWTERIERMIMTCNDQTFGFELEGFRADDPILAMRYGVGDHFEWHLDNSIAAPPPGTRKLSFSIPLSASASYDGGDLEFAMYNPSYGGDMFASYRERCRQRGHITIFPAFHLHRVRPIISGERVALVGWYHGPAFR